MRIVIGADQGGYELKQYIVERLITQGHRVQDFGTHSTESVDYPDIAAPVARAVAAGEFERGILICGTGIGMSLAANKIDGARAAVCTNRYMARMSRQDNDANILCLGGRVLGLGLALDIVQTFLDGEFLGGRHARRVAKISELEEKE
ncbi:MAG: ribose 5-phosphate isomerase B [Chloroflexi bacterium]|nr:MAG: ribose 5-phosphate isomerase B [Anaerolineaceae bacterium 4572_32.2]RLC80719.1 MAG: ribose 5-phosphate isomerase B [Chloroflexota bacterium]RLC81313.1 MAG: ribose 5-phosphate isomerase B [Chloroflexota bacterium]HEY74417.1 ribose 5-phosphate isomerase B [Thermoflexia bacterium]